MNRLKWGSKFLLILILSVNKGSPIGLTELNLQSFGTFSHPIQKHFWEFPNLGGAFPIYKLSSYIVQPAWASLASIQAARRDCRVSSRKETSGQYSVTVGIAENSNKITQYEKNLVHVVTNIRFLLR